ncbi:MAG: hypothetical protein Q8P88_01395 [Candidatus Jorgensenbacteria bacterium]|nr:hypothetical protein [Candidatus Jorgensenbacteria bacterium]
MGRRNIDDEEIRNIQKSKRSYYITLPVADVRALGWRERQKVRVVRKGKKLVVADWEPKR